MNRTKIVIRPRLREGEHKLLIGVESLGLEKFVVAHHSMWNIVAVDPCNLSSHRDGDGRLVEGKVINLHFRRRGRGSVSARASQCHKAAKNKRRKGHD